MIKTEVVNPNVGNFVESIRDIGYSFEVAVADLVDNSISAECTNIEITILSEPELVFCMLDNGIGMSETEVVEAMRLASRNPRDVRSKTDLGRFGLGLKTASFSQCRRLTVISKKDDTISCKQWDLDYISTNNKWLLISPSEYKNVPLYYQLESLKCGTLVCWESIDRCEKTGLPSVIDMVRKHLSLVFHRFLEGSDHKTVKIQVNNNPLKPFNPFNLDHPATQQLHIEKIKLNSSTILVQPYILPHHSKLSQKEYEFYATEEGYIKSQGFYLYRQNRILIHGTWWGLHKAVDAHKLVRIKIDIPNNVDDQWGIDIKKSTARPADIIKSDLRRIISRVTELGAKPYTGRGRKIDDKNIIHFWEIIPLNEDVRFAINQKHPLFTDLESELSTATIQKLRFFLKGLQAYLPIEAIQFKLQHNPHQLNQQSALSEDDIKELTKYLLSSGLTESYVSELLKTEIYINRKALLNGE
jgi:hypothetical protein